MKFLIFLNVVFSMATAFPSKSYADRFIFVVNTTENDNSGPATAAYLDEARWMREWDDVAASCQTLDKKNKVRVIPIRANSNSEISKKLEFWMQQTSPEQAPHEVLGLAVYSHGYHMILLNESEQFKLQLPADIADTFRPLRGRFANGARIILTGCDVLWGQSEPTARTSLKSIADSFQLKEGVIYANYSKGLDPYTLAADPFNSEIKIQKRLAALATYMLWPFSGPMLPIMSKYVFNQGYALKLANDRTELFKVQQNSVFKANAIK